MVPGGIDSFIRGVLRWAPDDLQMRMVGVTTEPNKRPLRRWSTCEMNGRSFEFYPVISIKQSERQPKIPIVLKYIAALIKDKPQLDSDVLEFHRIEPCIAFLNDHRAKNLVVHQDMSILRNQGSDIRWKYIPGVYFAIEARLLKRFQSIFCVRESAVQNYRARFPQLAERFRFTPTWLDTEVFQPPSPDERHHEREEILREFGFSADSRIFVSVGRLDSQKDPLLMVSAFALMHDSVPEARLIMVGDGVLRSDVEELIQRHQLQRKIRMSGVKPATDIARYLRASDAFLMSSSYEGMPISVLEALGCGLPVVSTDVGEVSRVVHPGINGELVSERSPALFAKSMAKCLRESERYRGPPSYQAVTAFTPHNVLVPIYQNYRNLAANVLE